VVGSGRRGLRLDRKRKKISDIVPHQLLNTSENIPTNYRHLIV